jgi:integrase
MTASVPAWFKDGAATSHYLPPVRTRLQLVPLLRDTTTDNLILCDYREAMKYRRLAKTTIRVRGFWVGKLLEHFGDVGIEPFAATTRDLEGWLFGREDWSQATQVSVIASLRGFYRWAVRDGRMVESPALDLANVRVHRRPSRIAEDDEIRRGLSRANVAQRAMILLGAECGLRVSEIASLNISNREGDWLHIVGKGEVRRSVWMSAELAASLDDLEHGHTRAGWYFPGRSSGPVVTSTIWRQIRDLVGCNPHALRHRAGTTVYRGTGNDIRVAQEFLGHASPTTTAIYVHVERDDLVAAGTASRLALG